MAIYSVDWLVQQKPFSNLDELRAMLEGCPKQDLVHTCELEESHLSIAVIDLDVEMVLFLSDIVFFTKPDWEALKLLKKESLFLWPRGNLTEGQHLMQKLAQERLK